MMEFYARTDLACENFGERSGRVEGAEWRVEQIGGFSVGRLRIRSESAARELGKPRGVYVTVESGKLSMLGEAEYGALTDLIADELRQMAERLTKKRIDSNFCILVAGLGNAELTAELEKHKYAVIPGFYGSTPNGTVQTFSRGGSDITGSIVARAVGADLCENWTDVDGFLMADPRIIEDPKPSAATG